MKIHSRKSSGGFTLIELLVAMAITTVIVTILVSITALSLDTWNRSRSEIRAARQGEAMIDSMARDFESLVIRKGNNFQWLFAESNPPAEGPGGSEPPNAKPPNAKSPNAVDLIFFSAATDRYDGEIGTEDDKGGDVSTIAYKLSYKDPISASVEDDFKTFVLYRKIVNPYDTFNIENPDGTSGLLGQENLKDAFDEVAGGDSGEVDEEENFICENVYQFTATFHVDVPTTDSGGTTTVSSVPVSVGPDTSQTKELIITGNGIEATVPSGSSVDQEQLNAGKVSAVEISLTVITDFGLKQLKSPRTFSNVELEEFIDQNSYQYSKLIRVPGS